MTNNHKITREIGNLRGFSTDSMYLRPANVADKAINIQRAPDGTTQLRRGYQCQIAKIGGMGIGTFDDPVLDRVQTVCVGMDGYLYNKLTNQIFLYYNGTVNGFISNITQANPAQVTTTTNHGLATGAVVYLNGIDGMVNLNNQNFTITVTGLNTFTLDGIDSSLFPAYISGGTWAITFTRRRYLNMTIFTDPRFLSTNLGWSIQGWSITPWGAPSGESITCNIIEFGAAQVTSAATNVNTFNVAFGHDLITGKVIQFYSSNGALNQRNVTNATATTITFDGIPVTINNNIFISSFYDIPFRKGFDVTTPYLISDFINVITDPIFGIFGLEVTVNNIINVPAAFLQIFEPVIIDTNIVLTLNYWTWAQVNYTIQPPFPGSANIDFQNSPLFENASMAAFDDVIYIANGWDFPQKYDGQTVYRTGMPLGQRPLLADNIAAPIMPFSTGDKYEYAITYRQIDNRGHSVEGALSLIQSHTVGTTPSAIDVTVQNLISLPAQNWNTNFAIAAGGLATVYGPDRDGFYYDFVTVSAGYTMKIGDSAYYEDQEGATTINAIQTNVETFDVLPGHVIEENDRIYFVDSTNVQRQRSVTEVTASSITFNGQPLTVSANTPIAVHKVSSVYNRIAIVNGDQTFVNTINVLAGHNIVNGNVIAYLDAFNRRQRRTVTGTTPTSITFTGVFGTPYFEQISDGTLIVGLSSSPTSITLRRLNTQPARLGTSAAISNNLRIKIYRTLQGKSFAIDGNLLLVNEIPNNGNGTFTQVYTDDYTDAELTVNFVNIPPQQSQPGPPPISKYLKAWGSQMFYAGGARGNPDNSDNVFFSIAKDPTIKLQPEIVLGAGGFFAVPNADDDVTGIGVSGSTLVVTKNHSLWGISGNIFSDNVQVIQIAAGSNIGCAAHASIQTVGTLMYFLHTNGVYAITENQLYPTDPFGNPIPLSLPIDVIFRETNLIPKNRYVFKRATAMNYTKDNQYLLFLPCENENSSIRTANANSIILSYDYQEKNWYQWNNMNAAGGFLVIDDDLYFQERRFSGVDGNTANLYKQHRFYRLIDHADHAGPQKCEWRSSWEDLGQPEVRKKFCRCILLMDRLSELLQYNNPIMNFSSYTNRLPNLQNTISTITQVDNIRNSSWSYSGWGWNFWSGYQDSFITVNLKQGTVAKSIQVGFTIMGINMDIKLAGFQLEIIPENRKTVVR